MKLWGGRFEEGPSEVFERFSGSLHFDRRLIQADIQGSQAFARALEGVGILTAAERAQLVAAFDQLAAETARPEFYQGAVACAFGNLQEARQQFKSVIEAAPKSEKAYLSRNM